MQIFLANPRGFCAGVDRAIAIVERALAAFGAPVYVRHEVVHNRFVVDSLKKKGAIFVQEVDEIPEGAYAIFSAHGVAKLVKDKSYERKLKIFDATCPLVTKVHIEVAKHSNEKRECILIGHAGHPEVEGTMGQYDCQDAGIYLVQSIEDAQKLEVKDSNHLAFVTQTTLSLDDTQAIIKVLKERFPQILAPRKDDICYATQNRQDAVKALVSEVDVLIVVGSQNSSNSNRLREIAERENKPAYLVDDRALLQKEWVQGKEKIGVTAGASAPEVLVQSVIEKLKEWGADSVVECSGIEENITFSLPKALRHVEKI